MNAVTDVEIRTALERKRVLADGVVELRLAADGLPAWQPGAHIDLVLPSGTVRQYSLCGDPADPSRYTVSVLKDPGSRGGSREVHDELEPGAEIVIRGPRNHFELGDHAGYLFFAGGIGITPILAMARQVAAQGKPWRVVYGGRSLSTMAYLDELSLLEGGRLDVVPTDTQGYVDFDAALAEAEGEGWHVYSCGPEAMLKAVEAATVRVLGADALHFERFGADPDAVLSDEGDTAFEVELVQSGVTLQVEPQQRLIDVVRTVVPNVPFSCEEGYCGSCETGVLAGIPLHRDTVLSDEERACNDTMMICVGRAMTPTLQLDI